MVTVIYIDVLLFVNIIVNYFLLRITAFFTGVSKRRGKTALAAIVGSLFSLVVLLPHMQILLSLLVKVAGAVIMAVIAYGVKKGVRFWLRNTAYLFVASTILAGAVIAVEQFADSGAFLAKNMGIYIDIAPLSLIVIVLVVYVALCVFELLFKKHRRLDKHYRATIRMGERAVTLDAMLDSGNKLYDTLSGRDAVVVKRSFSKRLLTQQQEKALRENMAGESAAHTLSGAGEFALLPFTSVGGQGLLLGFGAQSCEVETQQQKKIKIDRPFVAFADDALLGETECIIGYDAVEV